jgi:hypothetical protein
MLKIHNSNNNNYFFIFLTERSPKTEFQPLHTFYKSQWKLLNNYRIFFHLGTAETGISQQSFKSDSILVKNLVKMFE